MSKLNKASLVTSERNVAAGLKKNLPNATIPINGKPVKSKDVQAQIDAHIATMNKVADAKAAQAAVIASERAQRIALQPIIAGIRSHVANLFGEQSAAFASFGFRPRKVGHKSAATKAMAAAKLRATRQARDTMGSRQKAAIHGDVDESSSAEPTSSAASNGSSSGAAH